MMQRHISNEKIRVIILCMSLGLQGCISFSITLFQPTSLRTTVSAVDQKDMTEWMTTTTTKPSMPISNSILFFPPEWYSQNVTYVQTNINYSRKNNNLNNNMKENGKTTTTTTKTTTKTTTTNSPNRIEGLTSIQDACQRWERNFESDQDDNNDVSFHIQRVAQLNPDTITVQWNITWIPPTIRWMVQLAQWQQWKMMYRSYVDQSGTVFTFSYIGLFHLFRTAWTKQILTIPLACIQGTTYCTLRQSTEQQQQQPLRGDKDEDDIIPSTQTIQIVSIREELVLAQELLRGTLKNRKCAQDLKLFLQCGRGKINDNHKDNQDYDDDDDWDTIVEDALPWSSVPGLMGLEIDENAVGEEWVPIAFLGFSTLVMVGFASILAPQLLEMYSFDGNINIINNLDELSKFY